MLCECLTILKKWPLNNNKKFIRCRQFFCQPFRLSLPRKSYEVHWDTVRSDLLRLFHQSLVEIYDAIFAINAAVMRHLLFTLYTCQPSCGSCGWIYPLSSLSYSYLLLQWWEQPPLISSCLQQWMYFYTLQACSRSQGCLLCQCSPSLWTYTV